MLQTADYHHHSVTVGDLDGHMSTAETHTVQAKAHTVQAEAHTGSFFCHQRQQLEQQTLALLTTPLCTVGWFASTIKNCLRDPAYLLKK